MADVIAQFIALTAVPVDRPAYDGWLEMKEMFAFLRQNARQDEFILYAVSRTAFIHGLLVPISAVEPPDYEDLLNWNCAPDSSWGIEISFGNPGRVSVAPPLSSSGTKAFSGAEQLVFARHFDGRIGDKRYYEILQKFAHVSQVHFMPERQAYCRIDELGDIEDVIRIVEVPSKVGDHDVTVITCKRNILDEYAAATDSLILRTFDFTFCDLSCFVGWTEGHKVEQVFEKDLFYRAHIEKGHAAFSRGGQLVWPMMTKETILQQYDPRFRKERRYASFVAHDWKNGLISEICCGPGYLANYFTDSALPFETSPAFFRPEVLRKYKADSEKYEISDRSITCRSAWHLQTYDINEAGQVHTYLIYLRNLPYEEQLYWKSFNEPPKGPISKRAVKTDFEGHWHDEYDPLNSLKAVLRELRQDRSSWWQSRSDKLLDQLQYPATTSGDEWANDLMQLDQLVIEGLETRWLKKKATELDRVLEPNFASIRLAKECLLGLGFEEDDAERIVAPLRVIHDLRSKVKGHVSGAKALKIKAEVLREYRSYRNHFQDLCRGCDESIRTIRAAFKRLE